MELTIATPAEIAGVAGQVATSVAVTIALIDGEPFGTTIGSLIALSPPPLMGFSARTGSRLEQAVLTAGQFTVSALAEDQAAIAVRLARPGRAAGWTAFGPHELIHRNPAPPEIAEATAWIDCLLEANHSVGDHTLLIGLVVDSARNPNTRPLSTYRGQWRRLAPHDSPIRRLTNSVESPALR
jgi:3-hydroxy-9,10-secoandrosta-1,3,5(10)-triene-9,17-dione monooxygenase reductase component